MGDSNWGADQVRKLSPMMTFSAKSVLAELYFNAVLISRLAAR
jgi:hypothetical protein